MARLHEYQGKAILAANAGTEGFYLELDIPGLDELIGSAPRP